MLTKEKVYQKIEASCSLPYLPHETQELIQWLNTPSQGDIDQLAAIVEKDRALSDLILRHMNSNAFDLYKNVSDIKDAVLYLGMEFVRNFFIFFLSQQFFLQMGQSRPRVFSMRQYWKHVLATSVAAEMIGQRLGREDKYTLFSYGLNHDIGMLVMNSCMPDEMDEITNKVISGLHQIVAEKTVMGGLTHSSIGAWLCQRWHFAPDITRVVQHHHTPYLCEEDRQTLEIMYLADLIGTEYYEKLLNINSSMQINHKVLSSLGLTPDDQKAIGDQLGSRVELLERRFIL